LPRVLQLLEPPDGGVAEHVLQLARGLAAGGWEVELAGAQDSVLRQALADRGLPFHVLPFVHGYRKPTSDVRVLARLVPLLRRGHYDLVHCHSSKAGASGRVATGVCGVPAVYTAHGFAFKAGHPLLREALRLVERGLAPQARRIVCVSEDERRLAVASGLGGPERLRVIRNGCRACEPVTPDAALAALRAGGPLAAAVTVLRPEKGVDVFIDAVPLILECMPQARLAVVGSGPEEAALRERARGLEGEPRFRFLAYEPPVARHLRAIDVFVLASLREGLPISVLEAMACGVPQVATAVGGTPEAVTAETGLLVPPSDPAAVAEATVSLLRDPELRRRMAEASRRRHAERFTVERMVAETEALYREVLSNIRPRRARRAMPRR
jgi:glycosyltransferase involved in cell wall biosynthesis